MDAHTCLEKLFRHSPSHLTFQHVCVSLLVGLLLALYAGSSAKAASQAGADVLLPPGIKLTLPPLANGDEFGHSVDIDGDFLVASAWRTNVGANKQQGVVYLFERDSSDPLRFNVIKTLTANDGRAFHGFGSAVAIAGDTIVVGAIYDNDNSHFQAGAAYVFQRNHGGANAWGQVKKLVDANFDDEWSEHGYMGESVAIHGDTIVVGAPKQRGKVFVFERNQGGDNQWGEAQVLDTPNYWEGGSYGASLIFDGTRIVIGVSLASMVPARYNNEGAVFIFEHNDTEWVQVAKLFIADEDPETDYANNSRFGEVVSMYGDFLYVAAPSIAVDEIVLVGQVFVFQRITGNQWTLVGTITPTDNAVSDRFGASLYAVENGVFIASNKGLNGTVHFYKLGSDAVATSANAAAPLATWVEAYSFSTTEDVVSSRFGQPIAGSGNDFVVGASGYNAGQGGVYTYPLDELVTAAPGNPSATTGAYLPMVVFAKTQIPIEAVNGTLANDQILTGPAGFKIGATTSTLTRTINLSIATVAAPDEPLPAGISAHSPYFLLRGSENLLVDLESPFVVSLPVPDGADTGHLALAYLQPAGEAYDGVADQDVWTYLPGAYDAEQNIFLAKLPFVKAEGANLVLVQHPDLTSPLNAPSVQSAATIVRPFSAFCWEASYTQPGDCTDAMENEVKTFMDSVYLGMVELYGFPRKLRLLDSGSQFIVSQAYSVTALTATYAINIIHEDNVLCDGVAGSYNPESGFMLVCLGKDETLSENKKQVLVHELFHAIQFTYPKPMWDRQHGRQQDWIIEGMATSAMRSYFDAKMARTGYFGINNLRKVNMALTEGTANNAALDEYWSQDFWVYLGQKQNKNLGYLGQLLAVGGANVDGISLALPAVTAGQESFADNYWGWVKNQTIEHTLDLGGGPGQLCMLAPEALNPGQPIAFPSEKQYYPFTLAWEYLPPLTAQVVEVLVPHTDNSILVMVRYQECSTLNDPAEQEACQKKLEKVLPVKIYIEGEADCHLHPLPGVTGDFAGERMLDNSSASKRFFVVVANADLKEEHGFSIFLE